MLLLEDIDDRLYLGVGRLVLQAHQARNFT
jgi:hypothetical protein